MQLCRTHSNAARTLLDNKQPNAAWGHCGFAVEACLKAAIMSKERLNRWPDRATDPELWTHDLERLLRRLGHPVETFDTRDPLAPFLKVVIDWRREHSYTSEKFLLKFVRDMFEAALGPSGVVEWLAKRYRLNA
jgi:HEPN domain-containing protein